MRAKGEKEFRSWSHYNSPQQGFHTMLQSLTDIRPIRAGKYWGWRAKELPRKSGEPPTQWDEWLVVFLEHHNPDHAMMEEIMRQRFLKENPGYKPQTFCLRKKDLK